MKTVDYDRIAALRPGQLVPSEILPEDFEDRIRVDGDKGAKDGKLAHLVELVAGNYAYVKPIRTTAPWPPEGDPATQVLPNSPRAKRPASG